MTTLSHREISSRSNTTVPAQLSIYLGIETGNNHHGALAMLCDVLYVATNGLAMVAAAEIRAN